MNSTQISPIGGNGVPSALPGLFSLAQTGQSFTYRLSVLLGNWFQLQKVPVNCFHHCWVGFGLVMGHQTNKIWLFKFPEAHEFMTVYEAVSQFLICILNISAGHKSLRPEVRGI